MQTPNNNENNSKKKRIHLSPLLINSEKSFTNLRYHEQKSAKNDAKSQKKSFSMLNSSKAEEDDKKASAESKSLSTILYDDRFIPRPIRDIAAAQDAVNGLLSKSQAYAEEQANNLVEGVTEKLEALNACLLDNNQDGENRILKFTEAHPKSHENGSTNAVQFIRTKPIKPKWKSKRYIPKQPVRVLDAPDLINDYYLNLVHWGGQNTIAIGLGTVVYIWNGNTSQVNKIEPPNNLTDYYVSSVQWSGYSASSCLATGYSNGIVKLFDSGQVKCLRTLRDGSDRVPVMSWNENILSCGSRRGAIVNYDVRMQHAKISSLESHTREVCGLSWSSDGQHLASGGNDNQVYVWDRNNVMSNQDFSRNFTLHNAAVKAIAWHPIETNVLATGGGTADHSVNFWNVFNGSHLACLPVNSQVSSILWNPRANEFVTSHGSPQNQLTLWNYPSMDISAHLLSHSDRILSATISPDGTTVASIAADESLRFWKCFEAPTKRTQPSETDLEDKVRSMIH